MKLSLFCAILCFGFFTQAAEHNFVGQDGAIVPNMICSYTMQNSGWQLNNAVYYITNTSGYSAFGGVDAATYTVANSGHALCTSYGHGTGQGNFKMQAYSFYQGPFSVQSGSCDVSTDGSYSIDKSVTVSPKRGLISTITTAGDRNVYRYINYFLSQNDEQRLLNNPNETIDKCLDLLPGSSYYGN